MLKINYMQKKWECLIIDDDPDDQEIFLMCVGKVNSEVNCLTMDNGVDAISMLMANKTYIPDYIFIDVNMPKMNGIDCLRAIKNMQWLKGAKIFMYSTTSEGSVLTQSKELGATDFIIKPSKTAELREKLSKIFL
jgi:CheY-like chemotaxis protein